jgi:hypothetical protein
MNDWINLLIIIGGIILLWLAGVFVILPWLHQLNMP